MGAGRQPRRSRSSGQQMDGVPVFAGLCPGVHISVSEPVEHGVGRRIKSGLQSREFPLVDGVLPWRRRPAGEFMGHPPVLPLHYNLRRRLKELPPCALDLPDRAPIGRVHTQCRRVCFRPRAHAAPAVHQPLPGGRPPTVPHPVLDLVHGLHGGEDRRRSTPGLAVSLAVRHFGRARCEHPGQDCRESLDGVVTGAGSVHADDVRRPPSRDDEAPPTSCQRGSLSGRDRDRCAMLSGSRGARCACRSERRTWRC